MKTIKVFVIFTDGKIKTFRFSIDDIKKDGLMLLVKKNVRFCKVQRILTQMKNYLGHYYVDLNYDHTFETWRNWHQRVERINNEGYEDFTGYGSRTSGIINRFYIGKSTGWLPIYLEILRSDSSGGCALSWKHGKFSRV